jgi:23S rRNA (cytidine1920-2'-O)/16S rRNA (cytidine1409-2'-O)-methyltransferase
VTAGKGNKPARLRVDSLLVERGLAATRSQALALVLAGRVYSRGQRIDKAGTMVSSDVLVDVSPGPRFVSRGGDKLSHALTIFEPAGLSIAGKTCVDIGASTGGFTDCLLQHAAAFVYAVDVGSGQLHPKLAGDERVAVRDRTNARALRPEDFDRRIDVVTVDASFIGLGTLMPAIAALLAHGGEMVALIKPQFEVGRREAARGRGVVRDPRLRAAALARVLAELEEAGFETIASVDSALRGPKGNLEHFVYARRGA